MNSYSQNDSTGNFKLTWGLAIATYNRSDVLLQSISYALQQTRKPVEIVICDSSDDWDVTRTRVDSLVRSVAPGIRLWYGHSPIPRQTIQRNVAIDHSTADVLFMIDDDAFLAKTAADTIMRLYEADVAGVIAAVGVADLPSWPPINAGDGKIVYVQKKPRLSLKSLASRVIGWHFWARRMSSPDYPIPNTDIPVRQTTFLDG